MHLDDNCAGSMLESGPIASKTVLMTVYFVPRVFGLCLCILCQHVPYRLYIAIIMGLSWPAGNRQLENKS